MQSRTLASGPANEHFSNITLGLPVGGELWIGTFAGVITSYSIHYTKLYELANFVRSNSSDCGTAPQTGSSRLSPAVIRLPSLAMCRLSGTIANGLLLRNTRAGLLFE